MSIICLRIDFGAAEATLGPANLIESRKATERARESVSESERGRWGE